MAAHAFARDDYIDFCEGIRRLTGIDLATATLDIAPPAIAALAFRREAIRLDAAINAAEEANRLVVTEGIPFRQAYQRIAAKLRSAAAAPHTGDDSAD